MSDKGQIAKLADFIMAEVPGEPSRSEGAGDAAIRIMREQQQIIRELEQTMIELKPNPVLVEGSWFEVDDLPTILGNFIRSSAEYARDAKDAWIQVESLREQLAARDALVESLREQLVDMNHELAEAEHFDSGKYFNIAAERGHQVESLREQLAARDVVIARVRQSAEADLKCPCCAGYEFILKTLDAAPASTLAEHDARVLEEAADRTVSKWVHEWLLDLAAEYRKGAGQ